MPNFRFHTLDVTNSLLGTGLKALLPKCTFRTAPQPAQLGRHGPHCPPLIRKQQGLKGKEGGKKKEK